MQRLRREQTVGLFKIDVPNSEPNLDRALSRVAELLRPHCGVPEEKALVDLATAVFLEGARFGLAWVESREA